MSLDDLGGGDIMNMRALSFASFLASAFVVIADVAEANDGQAILSPRSEAWLTKSAGDLGLPPPSASEESEIGSATNPCCNSIVCEVDHQSRGA
jgi:hypothetical protein